MIEEDGIGIEQLKELLKHRDSSIFNDWEQRFLDSVKKKRYSQLSKHERAVISRLYDFFRGA